MYHLVSVILFFGAIVWTIFTIFKSFGTQCFDLFDAYATITILFADMIWNNIIKI